MSTKETVQNWVKRSMNDPMLKILAKNSNLTRIQIEAVLIDFLAQNLTDITLTNEKKAALRISKAEISRGAFNRTLKQARTNVIQSIYTVLLMGYLGIFNDTRLDPYLEVANKLKEYVNAYHDILSSETLAAEHIRIAQMLQTELEASLEKLARTRSLSKM